MHTRTRLAVRRTALLAALGVLAVPAAARAASLGYTGQLQIGLAGNLGASVSFTVAGSGVAVLNGSGPTGGHLNTLALSASDFAATGQLVVLTDPNVFPIAGIQATLHNGPGAFAGGAGPMSLPGVAKLCLFGTCGAAVGNLSVPLHVVGAGGTATVVGAVNVTVVGGAWTTGTAFVGTLTAMGFAHGPNGFASSTAQASGVIQLVTPIFVSTNIGSFAVAPFFGTLTLQFVPEPATFGLLAGGLGALGLGGRRRMRRR